MPGCRYHGLPLPCHTCIKKDIPRLEAENEQRKKQGRTDLHDVENLKRIIGL